MIRVNSRFSVYWISSSGLSPGIGHPWPHDSTFYSFWNMPLDAYPADKLKYHLGQVHMLQFLEHLTNQGHPSVSAVCDATHLLYEGDPENRAQYQESLSVVESFLTSVNPNHSRRVSHLIQEEQRARPTVHTQLVTRLKEASYTLRQCLRSQVITDTHEILLQRHREYGIVPDPALPLRKLADAIRTHVAGIPDELVLPLVLYMKRRPDYSDDDWLMESLAALILRNDRLDETIVMVEGNRSAYVWLAGLAIQMTAERLYPGQVLPHPPLLFLASLPALHGGGPMRLADRAGCVFLASSDEEISEQVRRANASSTLATRLFLEPPDRNLPDRVLQLARTYWAPPASEVPPMPIQSSNGPSDLHRPVFEWKQATAPLVVFLILFLVFRLWLEDSPLVALLATTLATLVMQLLVSLLFLANGREIPDTLPSPRWITKSLLWIMRWVHRG